MNEYREQFYICDIPKAYDLQDDILYVLVAENEEHLYTYHLMKFDIKKRTHICNIKLFHSVEDYYCVGLINGVLYMCETYGVEVNIYDFKNTNNYIDPIIKNIEILYKIICLNNTVYYIKKKKNETYSLYNIETDVKYRTIKFESGSISIDDRRIYVNISERSNITYFDNFLIFREQNSNTYIKFNMDDNTFSENYISRKWEYIVTDDTTDDEIFGEGGCKKKIIYNGSNFAEAYKSIHISDKNTYVYDFQKEKNYKLPRSVKLEEEDFVGEKIYGFVYKGDDYYIKCENNYITIYIDIKYHRISNKNRKDRKDRKVIIIGSKDNNVEIPTNVLISRSKYIDEMKEILEIDNIILREELKNIKIYVDYLNTSKKKSNKLYNSNKLYKLFYICNYLLDIDTKYVGELIIKYVKENKILDINEAFKYLELLSTSICEEQYIVLIYVIFKKYDKKEIIKKILGDVTFLNNDLISRILDDYL